MAEMKIIALCLLLLAPAAARAQSTATLRGIDVYRSTVLNAAKARELFGARLNELVLNRNTRRPVNLEKAEALRKAMEAEAAKLPGVAWAGLTVSEYFTSVDHALYATFDVVDEADRARLAFIPPQKKTLSDPDGLLAAWKQYYELGSTLAKRGEMPVDRPECPGFYCLWGGPNPELAALQKKFVDGAGLRERDLRGSLAWEQDPERRAAALYVLSYGPRGEKVLESCGNALKDSSPLVRGAALQILADIINHRKDLPVSADLVLPLLDDPSVSVRGKTLGLLVPLADEPAQRKKLMAAVPRLLDMLKLSEPGSSDLAYTVLGQLSQKSLDRRDWAGWEKWAAQSAEGFKK